MIETFSWTKEQLPRTKEQLTTYKGAATSNIGDTNYKLVSRQDYLDAVKLRFSDVKAAFFS